MHKTNEPKTIAYDYLFNYFGKDVFNGKVIAGACVQLAIKVYKNEKEIKFIEEPKYKDCHLCDVYKVSFDRENLLVIQKNFKTDNIFRTIFEWDEIEAETIGYSLNYLDTLPDEVIKKMPEELNGLPSSSPMEVTKNDFEDFLRKHIDDFDIPDNMNAQVPSVSFI